MSTKASEEESSSHLDESDIPDEFIEEDADKLGYFPGKTITLQMLLGANVLQPGKGAMTIEYLGQKFVGDLMADGKIKSQETETIFCSPSAWAIYCKRIINPDKKSGCGWASVKYKGRKLDAYKAAYYKKQQKERDQKDEVPSEDPVEELEEDKTAMEPPLARRNIVTHNTISNRNIMHDSNTLIEAVPFTAIGKMQPFLVTVSTSTLLVMDFHCHLTNYEVCGYLGGTWDINAHNLSITHAFPCRNTRHDRDKAALCELQIQKLMIKKNINLVGWYHSHPRFPVQPTLRDCDAQLDYQIRMRGPTEASYIPCIGFICCKWLELENNVAPYDDQNTALESSVMSFWVMPPPENRPAEYGRPMLMSYTLIQDETLSEDVKEEMMLTVDYYKQFKRELINFQSIYINDVPYIEKLRKSLTPRFPRDSTSGHFWNWIRELLGLEPEDIPEVVIIPDPPPPPPVSLSGVEHHSDGSKGNDDVTIVSTTPASNQNQPVVVNLVHSAEEGSITTEPKNDDDFDGASEMGDSDVISLKDDDGKPTGPSIAVPSLQAQLKRPSGLNMTPSPLSSSLVVLPTNLGQTGNNGGPPALQTTATNLTMNSGAGAGLSNNHHHTHQQQPSGQQQGQMLPMAVNSLTTTNTSSPRDSPITIPSNSASPAKFEMPVRASPSPAKSDTSSCRSRTRNSPAPSPGKLSIGDILGGASAAGGNRGSPTLSSLIGPAGGAGGSAGGTGGAGNIHDLYAATFASLGSALPSNLLSQDYAALFGQSSGGQQGGKQQRGDEYGLSALTALAQVAAASGLSNSQINETLLHSLNRSISSKASGSGGGSGVATSAGQAASTITSNTGTSVTAGMSGNVGGTNSSSGLPPIPNMKEFMQQLEKGNLSLFMQSQYGNPLMLLQQAQALGNLGSEISIIKKPSSGSSKNNSSQKDHSGAQMGQNASSGSNVSASNSIGKKEAAANELITKLRSVFSTDAYLPPVPTTADINLLVEQSQKYPVVQQILNSGNVDDIQVLLKAQSLSNNQLDFAAFLGHNGGGSGGGSGTNGNSALNLGMLGGGASVSSEAPPTSGKSSSSGTKGGGGGGSGGNVTTGLKDGDMAAAAAAAAAMNPYLAVPNLQAAAAAAAAGGKGVPDLNLLFGGGGGAGIGIPGSNSAASSPGAGGGVSGAAGQTGTVGTGSSGGTGACGKTSSTAAAAAAAAGLDYLSMFPNFSAAAAKMPDMSALFAQDKYEIPDPLSKATLEANNMYLAPSASLLKLHQEAFNSMLMKPPKSSSSSTASSTGKIETPPPPPPPSSGQGTAASLIPSPGSRLTPTKSANSRESPSLSASGGSGQSSKYNFSAVDLAVSSVVPLAASSPLGAAAADLSRKSSSQTPPMDMSRSSPVIPGTTSGSGTGTTSPGSGSGSMILPPYKKRMEFASIADLVAAPPAKIPKISTENLDP
uniref:MPN domain-containing protein n=1 Tax=Anopheles culicifacies TaxID=139723 RepID=A0A182MSL5_9DIPT